MCFRTRCKKGGGRGHFANKGFQHSAGTSESVKRSIAFIARVRFRPAKFDRELPRFFIRNVQRGAKLLSEALNTLCLRALFTPTWLRFAAFLNARFVAPIVAPPTGTILLARHQCTVPFGWTPRFPCLSLTSTRSPSIASRRACLKSFSLMILWQRR